MLSLGSGSLSCSHRPSDILQGRQLLPVGKGFQSLATLLSPPHFSLVEPQPLKILVLLFREVWKVTQSSMYLRHEAVVGRSEPSG